MSCPVFKVANFEALRQTSFMGIAVFLFSLSALIFNQGVGKLDVSRGSTGLLAESNELVFP